MLVLNVSHAEIAPPSLNLSRTIPMPRSRRSANNRLNRSPAASPPIVVSSLSAEDNSTSCAAAPTDASPSVAPLAAGARILPRFFTKLSNASASLSRRSTLITCRVFELSFTDRASLRTLRTFGALSLSLVDVVPDALEPFSVFGARRATRRGVADDFPWSSFPRRARADVARRRRAARSRRRGRRRRQARSRRRRRIARRRAREREGGHRANGYRARRVGETETAARRTAAL